MLIKVLGGLLLTALLILSGAVYWVDQQFEEPDAVLVPSITGKLGGKSVLAVFAHPDDEQLVTGFLLRAVEMDGAETNVVTATKGEKGKPNPQISRRSELGIIRKAETLKNTYALKVAHHDVWDYPDGGVPETDQMALRRSVRDAMERHRPDIILTFWPESGFTGHSDHQWMGRVATEVAEELAAEMPDQGPRYIAYILAPRRMMLTLGGEAGKFVVEHQPAPNYAMPGEGWAKIRGWDIHASQANFVQDVYGVPAGIVHRLYDKEHYYVRKLGG